MPAELREPLREVLEHCTAEQLRHRYPTFEPVLRQLAELDPADRRRRETETRRQQDQAEREEAERDARGRAEQERLNRARLEREVAERERVEQERAEYERECRETEQCAQAEEARRRETAERQWSEAAARQRTEDEQRAAEVAAWHRAAEAERPEAEHARRRTNSLMLLGCFDPAVLACIVFLLSLEDWNSPRTPVVAESPAAKDKSPRLGSDAPPLLIPVTFPSLPLPANPKPGDVYTLRVGEPAVELAFCWIPPGTFQMGGTGHENEKTAHKVSISKGFRMGQTEVTQAQWKVVMGTDLSQFKGQNRPVESVSWDDAQQFCQRLQQSVRKGGLGTATVRLPTEAEWQYACLAGTATDYWNGTDEAALKQVGWYDGNSKNQTQPVGQLKANPWGLLDVHGNVWEWCQDGKRDYTAQEQVDPIGKLDENSRLLRGGCWRSNPDDCRAASRWNAPAGRSDGYGFRVCFRLD